MKLKRWIKTCIIKLIKKLPLRNIILLESYPDFTDNTWAVFQELRKLERKKHFKCVWIGKDRVIVPKGVRYVNMSGTRMEKIRWEILRNTAKVLVSCNRFYLEPIRKGQLSLFLTHGSPLKVSPTYSYENKFHYVLAQSPWMIPYVAEENSTDIRRLISLGIPRNDALYHTEDALDRLNYTGYRKIIAWLPTYRQHNNGNITDMAPSPLGLPIFQNPEDVIRLNEVLRAENVLLVAKPHPAQNISLLQEISATNITFMDNDLLHRAGVDLYSFLGASDALITDYSSVYYDYLLTGKPIGLTLDDLEAYTSKRGFVYDDPREVLKGTEILNMEDFISFVHEISNDDNPHQGELAAVDSLVNEYHDDRSSARVADFILKMLKGDVPGVPETRLIADSALTVREAIETYDKDEKYLFSVITAVYNVEDYLEEAVESIIHQDIGFEHVQLILVDDGSTDRSPQICDAYARKYSENIIVIHKENGGVSSARNAGIEKAEGLLLNFFDSDDKLKLNCLSKVYSFFCNHRGETDVIAFPVEYFGAPKKKNIQNQRFNAGTRLVDLKKTWDVTHTFVTAAYITTDVAKQFSFDEHLKYSEDCCYIQKILLRKESLGLVKDTSYLYRVRADGSSATQQNVYREAWYLPVVHYYMQELLNYANKKKGFVPRFTQNNIMYDVQWRLKQKDFPEGVLSEEEQRKYISALRSVLNQIDDEVILSQRNLSKRYKALALQLKGQSAVEPIFSEGDILVMQGDVEIERGSDSKVKYDNLQIKDDILVLSGSISLFVSLDSPFRFGIMANDAVLQPEEVYETKDTAFYDFCLTKELHFTYRIPLNDEEIRLRPFIAWEGHVITLNGFRSKYPFPLVQKYKTSQIIWERWRISHDDGVLSIRATGADQKKHERELLRELWVVNQKGGRKAVLLRTLSHALKAIEKPLWLVVSSNYDNNNAALEVYEELKAQGKARVCLALLPNSHEEKLASGEACVLGNKQYKWFYLLSERIYYDVLSETNPFKKYDEPYRDLLFEKHLIAYIEQTES